MESGIHRGSCLCGAVRFEVAGALEDLLHCHCRMCQKAHGAVFATFAGIRHRAFTITGGEDRIRVYRSSPEACRTFCSTCGSTLQFVRDGSDCFGLAVSTLDDPIEPRPIRECCVDSKVEWLTRTGR